MPTTTATTRPSITNVNMRIEDVLPPDAISSIDEPRFAMEYPGTAADDVIVVEEEPPRAYPIRVLNAHEIVNDEVSGDPVAVTWCPLCGCAIVYRRVIDDRTLTFGVSGKLADDDLVMYDRQTASLWKQSRGVAFAGPLEGAALEVMPHAMMPVDRFRRAHPNGLVLQPERPWTEYPTEPYERYATTAAIGRTALRGGEGTRIWQREDIHPKTVVLGLEMGAAAVGVPQPVVEASGGAVRTTLGDLEIVVLSVEGDMYAFADPGVSLRVEDGRIVGDGTTWDPVIAASADGRSLDRLPAKRMFAFTWQDDHGPDAFFTAAGSR